MLNKIIFFLQEKLYILIFLSIIILLSLPHLQRYLSLGSKYTLLLTTGQNISQLSWEETYAYATLVNRLKHNQNINDPYIYEYRNTPSPYLSELYPAFLIGTLAKITSVSLAFALIKIVFPAIYFTLWFLIAKKLGFSQIQAAAASISTVFLPKLFSIIPYPQLLLYPLDNYLEIQRVFHPSLSNTVVVLNIFLLISFLKEKTKTRAIIFGLILGSLFYTYIFAWTLFWLGLFLFTLYKITERDFSFLFSLLLPVSIALLIGAPYFINALIFSQNPLSQDFLQRTAFSITSYYPLVILRYLLLFTMFIFLSKKWFKKNSFGFLIFLSLSALILPNITQLLLGVDIESDHWFERFLYPFSTFIFVVTIALFFGRISKKLANLILVSLVVLSLFRVINSTITQLRIEPKSFQMENSRQELFGWMENNLPKDTVIGSLSFNEHAYLAAYTPFYSYIPRGDRSIASLDEGLARYSYLAKLIGTDPNFIDQIFVMPNLNKSPFGVNESAFSLVGVKLHFDKYPFKDHREVLDTAKKYFTNPQYIGKLDYILIGSLEKKANSVFEASTKCELLYKNHNYALYKYYENCSPAIGN